MRMMRILFCLMLFFATVSIFAQKPFIFCERSSHNFGEIDEAGGLVTCVFVVKNIGKAPLVINNVEASCGCTKPVWTKKPILANQTGTIKVSFDPTNYSGSFSKTLKVISNGSRKAMTLMIKGFVVKKNK